MERKSPLLYRNRFIRWLIIHIVSATGVKKEIHDKFLKDLRECYPSCTYDISDKEAEKFFKDYLDAVMKFGISEVDYFTYEFYRLSNYGRSQYISERDRGRMHRLVNDKRYWNVIGDKEKFYKKYKKYMNRKVLYVSSGTQYTEFKKLCQNAGEIIVKPKNGQKGIGIHKWSTKNEKEIEAAWEECLKNKLLVEEVIKQDERIARFHPQSLNTIRIATAIDKTGIPHMMAAVLRVGADGNITDNASAGGLFTGIDVDSGIIISKGFDLKAKQYLFHPTTGVLFLGYQIPMWEELKQLACEVALVIPQMRYIGWDWVLTQEGKWELLEGNEPGGVHIIQQGEGRGMKNDYETVFSLK